MSFFFIKNIEYYKIKNSIEFFFSNTKNEFCEPTLIYNKNSPVILSFFPIEKDLWDMLNYNLVGLICWPVISCLTIILFYKKLSSFEILCINSFWGLFGIISLFSFFIFNFKNHKLFVVKVFDIICIFDYNICFDILIDSVTFIMLFVVIFISYFVILFSYWYMKGDPNFLKFVAFLNFFSFFMIILVIANNLILLFVGWEGIGLFSYLLINFWNTRLNANRSALKALVVNKIGDCFFYFFIFIYFFMFGSINIYDVKCLINSFKCDDSAIIQTNLIYLLVIFLIFAAMAKSAQVILHVWLPDAMEGPTPVSALLHAATMVTAGIYVLIKFNWLIFYNESVYSFVILIGVFTNLIASLIAIFQYDIKKIIAYSTASQLGLIFITFGILKFNLALFHLFNHAFFKALLFILAGIIIHNLFNNQDLRNSFFLKNNLFFAYAMFLLSSLTLMGFPFFSAFFSKDFIINFSFINISVNKSFVDLFLKISVITTVLYTFKLMNFLFFNHKIFTFTNVSKNIKKKIKFYFFDQIYYVKILVYCLAIFSIFIGYLSFCYFQNDFLVFSYNLISDLYLEKKNTFDYLELSCLIIIFLIIYSVPLVIIRYLIIKYRLFFTNYWKITYFHNKKLLFDNFYFYMVNFTMKTGGILILFIDRNIIERAIILANYYKNSFILRIKNLYFNLRWPDYLVILSIFLVDLLFIVFGTPNLIFLLIIAIIFIIITK